MLKSVGNPTPKNRNPDLLSATTRIGFRSTATHRLPLRLTTGLVKPAGQTGLHVILVACSPSDRPNLGARP